MPPKKTKKAPEQEEIESTQTPTTSESLAAKTVTRLAPAKISPTNPEDFIRSLNTAVANVQALFQLRDNLFQEITNLKAELEVAQEMKLEKGNLEALKREQDLFDYEFSIKKSRLEKELDLLETERKERLERLEEEHKERLKTQADAQTLKLRLEKEDHERKLKLEREDCERARAQFDREAKEFAENVKRFEAERVKLRESLIEELNRQNAHEQEVARLNHQKELELLKGELKLETANRAKFEMLLKETREQNEKLAEQLASLSREALVSASTASMANKLKDLVTQLAQGTGSPVRTN